MPLKIVAIPDTQCRPGVPTDHLEWAGREIAKLKPDYIVHLGDLYDNPACGTHEEPGSRAMEGARFLEDVRAGDEGLALLSKPIDDEVKRLRRTKNPWKPKKVLILGNHDIRPDRLADKEPKFLGIIGSHVYNTRDWEVVPFLQVKWIEGIAISHYFPNTHSGKAIGGEVPVRLGKVGSSFLQGHQQGKLTGSRLTCTGRTMYGLVAGSFYAHRESYRGNMGQRHWRGIFQCSEVRNGEFDLMELSLGRLCRKYTGMEPDAYFKKKYRGDWSHLS